MTSMKITDLTPIEEKCFNKSTDNNTFTTRKSLNDYGKALHTVITRYADGNLYNTEGKLAARCNPNISIKKQWFLGNYDCFISTRQKFLYEENFQIFTQMQLQQNI